MITLTPKTYKKGMKHSLLSSNKIDTVIARPISNLAADSTVFHSEQINAVNIRGVRHTLPISQNVVATHFHSSRNFHWGNIIVGNDEFAKARIECVLVSGKTMCKTDQVIQGTPTVNIRLEGSSDVVSRGGSTYDNYPSSDTLSLGNSTIADWIKSNKTETKTGLTHDYSGASFSMNPWIRNIIPYDSGVDPTPNDIVTDWVSTHGERLHVWWQGWTENSDFNASSFPEFRMMSPSALSLAYEHHYGTTLVMHNMYLPIKKSITKIDDYNYEVSWTVPVRVAYAAASRSFGIFSAEYDIDNFAYLDEVSSIIIELSGTPFSTAVQDISYSLDSSGNLSTVTHDSYPFEIDAEEALTADTYKGWYKEDGFAGVLVERGGYLDQTGTWVAQEHSFVTDYIWLPRNCIWFAPPNNTVEWYLQGCLYDDEHNLVGTVPAPNGNVTDTMAFGEPKGRYVRLNGKISDLDSGNYFVTLQLPYLWINVLSKDLLTKYSAGKYVVECVVSADWAIKNKVTINTRAQIKLLEGQYITRKNSACTFEVKNIEKRYSQNEFVFVLKLLEV